MAESVGNRMQRIMDEKGISREELQFKTKINQGRLRDILDAGLSPSRREGEYTQIAGALEVHEIELTDSHAQECGRFLRARKDYECFPKMFPTVASLPREKRRILTHKTRGFSSSLRRP